ncbi:MAG: hypothetical protein Q9225_003956 [Loekoesia sp. 1 TL-2023]
MASANEEVTNVLKQLASTLRKIENKLEQQGNLLMEITATSGQQRQRNVWPRINLSDELVLLEATRIRLPADEDPELEHVVREDQLLVGTKTFSYADARDPVGRLGLSVREDSYKLSMADRDLTGQMWNVPYDGRLPLKFSRAVLDRLPKWNVQESIEYLAELHRAIVRDNGYFWCIDVSTGGADCERAEYKWPAPNTHPNAIQNINASLVQSGLFFAGDWSRQIVWRGLPMDFIDFVTLHGDREYIEPRILFPLSDPAKEFEISGTGPSYRFSDDWYSFTIPFYYSLWNQDKTVNPPNVVFTSGSIFGDVELLIQKQEYKVIIISNRKFRNIEARAWTLVEILPSSFAAGPTNVASLNLPDAMMRCVESGLYISQQYWQRLLEIYETQFRSQSTRIGSEETDLDMFDDAKFTKSRKYFWAIKTLNEFVTKIEDSIRICQEFRNRWIKMYESDGISVPQEMKAEIAKCEEECAALASIRQRQKALLAEVIVMRDGLFNASAVMESRQATLLGKNVQLLTYVTIFFLPLAFSTSLWSINDSYPRHTLVWIATVVAACTYIVTFNLNWLVDFLAKAYHRYRGPLLQWMLDDTEETWIRRGKSLTGFRVKREQKPSEWLVTLYLARLAIRAIWATACSPIRTLRLLLDRRGTDASDTDEVDSNKEEA